MLFHNNVRNMQCLEELQMPETDHSKNRSVENAVLFSTDGMDGPTRDPVHSRLLQAT